MIEKRRESALIISPETVIGDYMEKMGLPPSEMWDLETFAIEGVVGLTRVDFAAHAVFMTDLMKTVQTAFMATGSLEDIERFARRSIPAATKVGELLLDVHSQVKPLREHVGRVATDIFKDVGPAIWEMNEHELSEGHVRRLRGLLTRMIQRLSVNPQSASFASYISLINTHRQLPINHIIKSVGPTKVVDPQKLERYFPDVLAHIGVATVLRLADISMRLKRVEREEFVTGKDAREALQTIVELIVALEASLGISMGPKLAAVVQLMNLDGLLIRVEKTVKELEGKIADYESASGSARHPDPLGRKTRMLKKAGTGAENLKGVVLDVNGRRYT